MISRFRSIIAAAGLNVDARSLLVAEPNSLVVSAPRRVQPWSDGILNLGRAVVGQEIGTATSTSLFYPLEGIKFELGGLTLMKDVPFISAIFESRDGGAREVNFKDVDGGSGAILSGRVIGGRDLFPIPQTTDLQVLQDARRAAAEGFLRLSRIVLKKEPGQEDFSGRIKVTMGLSLVEGQPKQQVDMSYMWIEAEIDVPDDSTTVVAFEMTHTIGSHELVEHLQENQLYYSQAVWRSLDPATIGILLSSYTLSIGNRTQQLVELVDPTPATMIANYLVFRMSGDDTNESKTWFINKRIILGSRREDLVPIPSGGVFAEAVLGRFNSAEKLDITRFWNWQDSPIPIQAPDIAPIQSGSRAEPDNTVPGQLSAPVLNIVNPPALPDPQGMGAVLAAIQNGNMFRDMSGLAATIGLAQAGLAGAQQGATDAAAQAGQNAAVAAQLGAKVAELAAKIVAAYFTGGASLAAGTGAEGLAGLAGGISGQGAKIRHGQDMDQRGISAQSSGTVTQASNGTGGSETGGGSGVGSATPVGGNESSAFNASLGSGPSGVLDQLLNIGMGAAPEAPTAKAWPSLDRTTVISRINILKGNANLFNQGGIGLCTAAAFYHHVIQKEPLQFYSFAMSLYGTGIAFLGKLKVAPGDDLRNADYNALARKFVNMPPQADWMLMSALRDSQNWFFDFEGAPDEKIAMRTSAEEMSDWYKETGFYSKVDYSDDRSLEKIKTIKKTANNHIALWIDSELLGGPRDFTHMITLESTMTIDEVNNKVKFDYWTWGNRGLETLQTSLDGFISHYHGVITATF